MRDRSFDETMIELLRKDPEFAAELLDVAIKENTPAELAITLRQISAAGYSVSLVPEPKPRKRAQACETKEAKRRPGRSRVRRSAAAIA